MTMGELYGMRKRVVMSSFSKTLKTGIKYIHRNRFLTISCVFSMTFSLFLFLVFVTAVVFSHFVLKGLEEKAQVTVFFKPSTAEVQILSLQKTLTSRAEIESVKYVSQDEALKIYLGQHQNDPTLLESVNSNILPASLEIKTRKLASLETLADELRKLGGVDEVVFFKDLVNTFGRWALLLRVYGMCLVAIMLLVSMITVLLAVGVSVKVRADEIEIMRLVGATDSQVTAPFLWQGTLYGLFSSVISLLLFSIVLVFVYPAIKSIIPSGLQTRELTVSLAAIIAVNLFLGPMLGIFSGFLGVKKYLRL